MPGRDEGDLSRPQDRFEKMKQLKGAMRALSLSLGRDTLKQLDELFPGPGGATPEAYTW
jgi:hypothetical protein